MMATSGRDARDAIKGAADFTLRIAPMMVELAPQVVISTIGYSNKVPGPLLRMREGQRVTVEVANDTDVPEYVHWHGLFVPSEVDGAEEEGTPPVPSHGRRRYQFVAKPAGSRWYHSHTAAMMDLHRGAYTGQFGFLMIDSANDPGRYDQEVFLALREWEPYLSTMDQDEAVADPNDPMPEKPATPDTRPNGLEVSAPLYSINDKMLGAGDPLRVKSGQRILMHLLNASASQIHRIGLFGHHFHVIALDGNPVPAPQPVDVIEIAPGERVDAIVEMNFPGVWILGELRDAARQSGMGIVVEYANQAQPRPQWLSPPKARWDYTIFGKPASHPAPDQTIDMIFEKVPGGPHGINHWLVNGKEYPHEREFVLRQGRRYRLVFHNRSDDCSPAAHPPAPVRACRAQRQADRRRHEGYRDRSGIWTRHRGSGRRPAGPDAVSLPYPAAHGLWFHGAVSLCLSTASSANRAGWRFCEAYDFPSNPCYGFFIHSKYTRNIRGIKV